MSFDFLRIARRVFSCALVLLVTACATSKYIAPDQTLKAGEGAFVVKIVTDADLQFSMVYSLQWIEVQRVDDPDSAAFTGAWIRRDANSPESMIFSGTLKPGRYQLVQAGGTDRARVSLPLRYYGTFEIRPGQLSMLGTLIIRPIKETRRLLGVAAVGYGFVQPDGAMLHAVEQYFPALAAQVKGQVARGFVLTPDLNDAADLALQQKQRSQYLAGVWQDERGNIYTARNMGRVSVKRAGQQGWREMDVGSWRGVSSFKAYLTGLIAGGEEGLFKFSSDDGKTWTDLVPPAWGQVAHIEVVRDNRLVVVVRRDATWTVFATDDPRTGTWKTLGTLPLHSTPLFFQPFSPSFVRSGNSLVIGGGLQDAVHIMDLDSGSVESIRNPIAIAFAINGQATGSLVLRGAVLKQVALLSEDGGRTWRELKPRGFVAFKDASNAYLVYDMHVAYSRDGGNKFVYQDNASWKEDDVREFLIDRSDQSLLVFLFDGSIYRSRDEGATWTKER